MAGEKNRMARIVLGLGTSHTPMLLASDETLPRFLETDQTIRHRDKVSWRMVGYPGLPATYASKALEYRGKKVVIEPQSIQDFS